MSHSNQRAPLTKARRQPPKLRGEIGVLGARRSPGRLCQRSPHIDVTLSGLAGSLFARGLVIARTNSGPGGQMGGRRETRHVSADFGDERFGHTLTDAWNGLQEFDGFW